MTETAYQKIAEIARDAELNFSGQQISVMLSQIKHQGFAHKCAENLIRPGDWKLPTDSYEQRAESLIVDIFQEMVLDEYICTAHPNPLEMAKFINLFLELCAKFLGESDRLPSRDIQSFVVLCERGKFPTLCDMLDAYLDYIENKYDCNATTRPALISTAIHAMREAIDSTVIKEIPIELIRTALAVSGDMNKPKYFSITYDMSKLSDDEQKAVIAEASSLFQSGKAVSAGWESEE